MLLKNVVVLSLIVFVVHFRDSVYMCDLLRLSIDQSVQNTSTFLNALKFVIPLVAMAFYKHIGIKTSITLAVILFLTYLGVITKYNTAIETFTVNVAIDSVIISYRLTLVMLGMCLLDWGKILKKLSR